MSLPQSKTPLEILEQQTLLLYQIQKSQPNLKETNDFLAKWLNAILEEERKQTKHLSRISGILTFMFIMLILGAVILFCISIIPR